MKRRVVQIAAGATPGDAITNEMEILYRHFLGAFGRSAAFAEHIAPGLSFPVDPVKTYRPGPDDLIVYHHSISTSSTEAVCRLDLPRVMIYHNITPAHFFFPYNPVIAEQLTKARRELPQIVFHFDHCYGDSDFNRREIAALGHGSTGVLPVLFPSRSAEPSGVKPAMPPGITGNSEGGPTLLFVGRIVPNKAHADLIKILYFVRRILPNARLVLAGATHAGIPAYTEELNRLTQYLGLQEAVKITGYQTEIGLRECYQKSDLFLCASRHEGYCIPVLEAMQHSLPVLAFAGGDSAVAETMDGAGVSFREMDHARAAVMACRLLSDQSLRDAVLARQNLRLERLDSRAVLSEITARLEAVARK